MIRPSWQSIALLILLCSVLYLPGLNAVPPLDRDEARFAQTTKEMVETGDFIHPRFQAAPRHKKPIGIYWLQAAAVLLAGKEAQTAIWPYRLPSVLGATAAVLLTYWLGLQLFAPSIGVLGAALLASSGKVQEQIRTRIRENYQFLREKCLQTPVECLKVQAGWYANLRLPRMKSEEEWVLQFLQSADTLVHPGYFYDFPEEAYVVISLLPKSEDFQEGVLRLLQEVEMG